jgi:hypothetical protein
MIDVYHREDLQILISERAFLEKRYRELYKTGVRFDFSFSSSSSNTNSNKITENNNGDEDLKNDHPLLKSIVKDLGGREIK